MKNIYLFTCFILFAGISVKSQLFLNGNFQKDTFKFTGSMQTYTVPPGVNWVFVKCAGASGAKGGAVSPTVGGSGGLGALISGVLSVTPGQVLNVFVGGAGSDFIGGFNGGGNGAKASSSNAIRGNGGGGGGATDIRSGGTALANRIVVAGGGGGGGNGGCNAPSAPGVNGGNGGNSNSNGSNGTDAANASNPAQIAGAGKGGAAGGAGGSAGTGCSGFNGQAGTAGSTGVGGAGGTGQSCCCTTDPAGGGGGGGLTGGGGGGGGSAGGTGCTTNDKGAGGGGGGGTNLSSNLLTATVTDGFQSGNGMAIIYTPLCDGIASVKTSAAKTSICKGDSVDISATADLSLNVPKTNSNGNFGFMFDVQAAHDLTIKGFDIITQDTGTFTLFVKTGTHIGSENSSVNWQKLGSFVINKADVETKMPLDISEFISAGGIKAFYFSGKRIRYSNASVAEEIVRANQSLRIIAGTGNAGNFTGAKITARYFVGTVHYNLKNQIVNWSDGGKDFKRRVAPNDTTKFIASIDAGGGICTGKDSLIIVVFPDPKPTISATNLILSTTNFAKYQWFKNGLIIPSANAGFFIPTLDGVYKVEVEDANGCKGISDPFFVTWVGVKDAEISKLIKIIPNPAVNGTVEIQFSQESSHMAVYNASGKLIHQAEKAGIISLNGWATGVYEVRILDTNGIAYSSRFIVQ